MSYIWLGKKEAEKVEKILNEKDFVIRNKDIQIQVLEEIINYQDNKIERLHSIIKEVREYTGSHFKEMVADEEAQKLLEILDKENERLNNIINECAENILKELKENHHLSYGVALAIRQKLIDYKELKGSENNE